MGASWLIADMVRSSAVVGTGLVSTKLLKNSSASTRRWVLAGSLVGSLLVPFVSHVGVSWEISPPAPLTRLLHVRSF